MLQRIVERLFPEQRGFGADSVFLSKRQFDRHVTVERVRSSRRGIPFCIIGLSLTGTMGPGVSRRMARLLLRNLRMTDEKAKFSSTEFAVLLVDTPQMGGRSVVDRLAGLFADNGLSVSMDLKVHDPSAFEGNSYDESSDDGNAPSLGVPRAVLSVAEATSSPQPWPGSASSFAAPVEDRRELCSPSTVRALSYRSDEAVSSDDPLVTSRWLDGALKRTLDITGAALGLAVAGPFLLGAMAAIRLTSPGSAIFCQTREGHRGRPFTIYKLRTMVVDAEKSQQALRDQSHRDGPAFKIKADPRVTKIGRFLRATCIDELPQLVNVLKGDMSIVGPRPLPWQESRSCSHWHRRRLDVRPGLTCFWQVDKASVETFDDWMRLDLLYVDRGNLWVDLSLIYRTFSVTLLGRGSH